MVKTKSSRIRLMKEYSYYIINQIKAVEIAKNEFNQITENHWLITDIKNNRDFKFFEDSYQRTLEWLKKEHTELLL